MRGRVGLIAGQGRLPILVARGMREAGLEVCAVGLAGQYEPELPGVCDRFARVGVLRLGQWSRCLRRMGAREAVMVGRVDKARLMHSPMRFVHAFPDVRTLRLWYGELRHDHRSPAVLAGIAGVLERSGVHLIDSTTHIPDQLAHEGVMTRHKPDARALDDVAFGWPILRRLLDLHVGQAIAVRERDVVAVEAVEGTDRMIQRAGELCRRGGWTLLKAAPPDHDRRADVPTVGVQTIRHAATSGCACIAVAARDVILVDKSDTLALADELGVSILGVGPGGPDAR